MVQECWEILLCGRKNLLHSLIVNERIKNVLNSEGVQNNEDGTTLLLYRLFCE